MTATNKSITLSERTKAILNNFAKVSGSIYLQKGNVLRTMDATGSIMVKATINEDLPVNFPVANLKGLLQTINLSTFKDASLEFTEEKVHLKAGSTSLEYYASDEDAVESIEEDVIPEFDPVFVFELDNATLTDLKHAAKSMNLPYIAIESVGGKVELKAYHPELPAGTIYTICLQEKSEASDFKVECKVSNLQNLLDCSSYTVKVFDQDGFNTFTATDGMLEYMIGHEEDM